MSNGSGFLRLKILGKVDQIMWASNDNDDLGWESGSEFNRAEPDELSHDQRIEYLHLLRSGLGRTMAATQLGIRPSTLRRTARRIPAFRQAIKQVEQLRVDNLYTGLYMAALKGDTRAAIFLLSRKHR